MAMQIILDEEDLANLPANVRAALLQHLETRISLNDSNKTGEENFRFKNEQVVSISSIFISGNAL